MKKIIFTIIGSLMVFCFFTNPVYAGAITNNTDGGTLTIGSLTFTPSAGTIIDGITSSSAFTLWAGNVKAQADGYVYLVASSTNKVYQDAVDLSAGASAVSGASDVSVAGSTDSDFAAR